MAARYRQRQYGDNTVGVLLGNGNGTFAHQATTPRHGPRSGGRRRLERRRQARHRHRQLRQQRGRVPGQRRRHLQSQATYATDRGPTSVAVADINGDGMPDIVTANYGGNDVSVLLGNGNGTFQPYYDLPCRQ